jgi:hypothetical protein
VTLPTNILVSAMLRRANDSGAFGAVLAKGHPQAGAILLVVGATDDTLRVKERGIGVNGRTALIDATPSGNITDYWQRRRRSDPDLWVIELVGAGAERFAAETLLYD